MDELDELMNKIELLFLKNTSIKDEHLERQDFLNEVKELIKNKFYSKIDPIKRYNVTPIIGDDKVITGISHSIDQDGVWVNYYDIRNYIEDRDRVIENLKNCISLLTGEHRINNNGV